MSANPSRRRGPKRREETRLMNAKKIRWKQVKHHWEIYLFIVPALVLIVLFQYYPAASGIFHSFYRWNGADISEFVGLRNYIDLLRSPDFWQSFRVALLLGLWNVVKMIPAIAVAVWIHRCSSERMQVHLSAAVRRSHGDSGAGGGVDLAIIFLRGDPGLSKPIS